MMPDEKKPSRTEISFLPPLKMVLAFFDRDAWKPDLKKDDTRPVDAKEYEVKRIIDRLKKNDQKSD